MSTRGIIAVVDGDRWKGFEVRADAQPDGVGVMLVKIIQELGFDVACTRARTASLFQKMRDKADQTSYANRADMQWIYFLDPVAKTLRAFYSGARQEAGAPTLPGAWTQGALLQFHADGTSTPPELVVDLPWQWPLIRVDDAWDLGKELVPSAVSREDSAATVRLATRRRIERECTAAGWTLDDFWKRVTAILTSRFFQAPWSEPARRVYVTSDWTANTVLWDMTLDAGVLVYPAGMWERDHAIETDGTTREVVKLFAEPNTVAVDIDRATLTGTDATLQAILRTALHGPTWLFDLLDALRARTVPDPRGEELERLALKPRDADDWQVFVHPDGRMWSIRLSTNGYHLRIGAPDDEPVFKERRATEAQLDELIREQLAEGFVRR